MSGVTKHIYEHEIRDIISMWSKQIKSIQRLLPKEYDEKEIISLLKQYYPHEWNSVEIKYVYYKKKDEHIKKHSGKDRYNMPSPKNLLKRVAIFKTILSSEYKNEWHNRYSDEECCMYKDLLWSKRKPKIDKINKKIENALERTQQMTPEYVEQLIGLYERKNTSQKDKVYILLELKKYYSPKIIQFFFKLNDTELNKQLRWEAFYHLQSFNYQPRARKQKHMQIHTKNDQRKHFLKYIYPEETHIIPFNPEELEYRIENSKYQKLKTYDYFISHSSKDRIAVQSLITYANKRNKSVFCDWINDVDYLKRYLVCNATLKVLEKRMEQSTALIFVESENSLKSIWCKYELNYFSELGKPIYVIRIECIENNSFVINSLNSNWFKDSNYKNLALLEGSNIKA